MRDVNHISVVIPMYRSGGITVSVISALVACRIPAGAELHIIVVDDASEDGSAALVDDLGIPQVTLDILPRNQGRSAARNHGARLAPPGALLFLDSDCVPSDEHFISAHLAALNEGAGVSMGAVVGANDGFWHEYQGRAANRRRRLSESHGVAIYGSSQNFMLDRAAFLEEEGFDEAYRGYGFEDRDLFLRLEKAGCNFAWTPEARVVHRDKLELRKVCIKMAEAGGAPARRFRERHSLAYRQLGYEALDARVHTWLVFLDPLSRPITRCLVTFLESRLDQRRIPIGVRMRIVRLVVAASYLHGTVRENDHDFLRT